MSKRAWIGGAALAVVLAVVITVAYVVQYTDGERPGAAFPGIGRFDSEHSAEVELPLGTLQVRVGAPQQEYEIDYSDTRRAADGAVLVPVGWELEGAQTGVSNSLPAYQYQLTLVADGRRYDLQAAREDSDSSSSTTPVSVAGTVAAVVQGEGTNLSLEVEYDGLTQVVDLDTGKIDSGLAAPYYAPGGLKSIPLPGCSALSNADQADFTVSLDRCSLGPVRLSPYVGGFGWVKSAKQSWATVPYSLQVGSIDSRRGSARYSVVLKRFDLTLDGAKPTADLLRSRFRDDVYLTGVKVFRTTATPKALAVTTELLGDSRFNDAGTRLFRNATTQPLT